MQYHSCSHIHWHLRMLAAHVQHMLVHIVSARTSRMQTDVRGEKFNNCAPLLLLCCSFAAPLLLLCCSFSVARVIEERLI